MSGAHDMARVLDLTRHFGIATAVCVNKWDLNPDMAKAIETDAERRGAAVAGRACGSPLVSRGAETGGRNLGARAGRASSRAGTPSVRPP